MGLGEWRLRGKEGMKGLTLKVPMGIPFRLYGVQYHRKCPKYVI
jgi:hypothetical protein